MVQPWARKWQSPFLIFMNKVETEILIQSELKPLVWKHYIDDIFSLWTINRHRIEQFIEQAKNHYPMIKFTSEISDKETIFPRTPTSTKAQDSKETQSLMCVLFNKTVSCSPSARNIGVIFDQSLCMVPMSMQSVNRPFSIFVTLVSHANILLMILQSSLFMPS